MRTSTKNIKSKLETVAEAFGCVGAVLLLLFVVAATHFQHAAAIPAWLFAVFYIGAVGFVGGYAILIGYSVLMAIAPPSQSGEQDSKPNGADFVRP